MKMENMDNYLNVIRNEIEDMQSCLEIMMDYLFEYYRCDYPEKDIRSMMKITLSAGEELKTAMDTVKEIALSSLK